MGMRIYARSQIIFTLRAIETSIAERMMIGALTIICGRVFASKTSRDLTGILFSIQRQFPSRESAQDDIVLSDEMMIIAERQADLTSYIDIPSVPSDTRERRYSERMRTKPAAITRRTLLIDAFIT